VEDKEEAVDREAVEARARVVARAAGGWVREAADPGPEASAFVLPVARLHRTSRGFPACKESARNAGPQCRGSKLIW
jgi:hypothetical protein